jgi:hypothetical protein
MNIFMYYIMSRKVEMKLILGQQRRTMSNMVPRNSINVSTNTNTNTNTILQSRVPSFGGNAFKGNMNGVFAARGRPCG